MFGRTQSSGAILLPPWPTNKIEMIRLSVCMIGKATILPSFVELIFSIQELTKFSN